MELIQFDKLDKLPFQDMNIMHEEELQLVNSIHQQIFNQNHSSEFENLLFKFAEHLKEHFAFEEYLMQETNCPILDCHKDEHDRVYRLMIKIFRDFAISKDINLIRYYFEVEYKTWLENHIKTMDLVTATFLNDPKSFLNNPEAKCHSDSCQDVH